MSDQPSRGRRRHPPIEYDTDPDDHPIGPRRRRVNPESQSPYVSPYQPASQATSTTVQPQRRSPPQTREQRAAREAQPRREEEAALRTDAELERELAEYDREEARRMKVERRKHQDAKRSATRAANLEGYVQRAEAASSQTAAAGRGGYGEIGPPERSGPLRVVVPQASREATSRQTTSTGRGGYGVISDLGSSNWSPVEPRQPRGPNKKPRKHRGEDDEQD